MSTIHFELNELEKIMEKVVGRGSGSLRSGGGFGTWMRRVFCYATRTLGDHKGKDVARYIGKDLATVTQGVRIIENLLRAGDHKTTNAVRRILDTLKKRGTSWKEREKILGTFFAKRRKKVTIAYLFGSRVRGKTGLLSDADIAVCFRDEKMAVERHALASRLKQLLGVEDVDLIVLNRSPVELRYRIIRDGKLIFCDSMTAKVEFEARVLSQYGDYLPVLERQRREILEAFYGETTVQRYRKALGQTERMLKQIRAT